MRASGLLGLAMLATTLSGCVGSAKPEVAQEPIIVCKNEAPAGTRFKQRICYDRRIQSSPQAKEATRQMMYGNGTDTVRPPGD
jgi:hypothetical protein